MLAVKKETKKGIFLIGFLPLLLIGCIIGAEVGDFVLPGEKENENLLRSLFGVVFTGAGAIGIPVFIKWLMFDDEDPFH